MSQLYIIAVILTGCAPVRHGYPVAAEQINGEWYCVDGWGEKWPSRGECD